MKLCERRVSLNAKLFAVYRVEEDVYVGFNETISVKGAVGLSPLETGFVLGRRFLEKKTKTSPATKKDAQATQPRTKEKPK